MKAKWEVIYRLQELKSYEELEKRSWELKEAWFRSRKVVTLLNPDVLTFEGALHDVLLNHKLGYVLELRQGDNRWFFVTGDGFIVDYLLKVRYKIFRDSGISRVAKKIHSGIILSRNRVERLTNGLNLFVLGLLVMSSLLLSWIYPGIVEWISNNLWNLIILLSLIGLYYDIAPYITGYREVLEYGVLSHKSRVQSTILRTYP
ncbi:hypothetical protein VFC49_00075 [Thermococcus sp. SY098]|uniref:hypothetical protein n=1 Tax=Thermococcus sp. SY098 TaxID=3111325 RepID=UPI002D76B9D3|nr:hypothetical protein [Thermococcus sp. SY098]WRS52612.1 hypothetical protein VFC49_00075 [Thermococcus sp. SY098]